MNKKKVMALMTGIMVLSTACGGETVETAAPVQEAQETEQPVTEETTAEQNTEVLEEAEVQTEDSAKEEAVAEEESTGNGSTGLKIGSSELDEICAKYDEVLSTYDVESYFGYNIIDGWASDDFGVDGRQECRYVDIWTNGDETVSIEGIDRAESLGTYVTDENGKEFIPPSDEFDYNNRYLDAIHDFYETREWKEPERPQSPVGWPDEEYGYERYCPIRIYQGEVDTPYGKGILCSAVYEGVRYTGYDEETHCYTKVVDTYLWSRDEEMILEIDDQFVIISYSYFEWSDLGENVDPSNLDYTGRLDETIPQMF